MHLTKYASILDSKFFIRRLEMLHKKIFMPTLLIIVFAAGFFVGSTRDPQSGTAYAQGQARVFELRTYTAHDGKLGAVVDRFRDHTMKIFAKHGMASVGYWTAEDAPLSQNTLIYILAHPSREAAKKNWDEFRNDPEWKQAKSASEASGPIVEKTVSVYLDATGFSPLR
jgi:hypothetical protein